MGDEARFLTGVTVLSTGAGTAGAVASDLLGALGASLTRRTGAGGDDARPGPRLRGDRGDRAVLDAVLGRRAQPAERTARPPDVEIAEGATASGAPGTGVLVTVTPFGLDGPRSREPGGDVVLQAASGLLGTVEGADGVPVPLPASVCARAVGTVVALAALHGLDRYRATGRPVHVDVSAQEALVLTAALPECAHAIYRCPGRAGSGRYLAPSGVFPAADGLVRIAAVENHQWQAVVRALGTPDWTAGLDERPARIEHAGLITERVSAWTRDRPKAGIAKLLQEHGVPATPVHSPADLLDSPQFRFRNSVRETELDGIPAAVLGPPWRAEAGGPAGEPRSGRLGSLRITELTHVLAGPIVGALLGAMGARVTRLEDPDRLDIYRRTGPFADGVPGTERGAYFAVANHSKTSVLVDPDDPAGHVARELDASDVLIENVGDSRLRRLGVDPAARAGAGALVMRVSGFGSAGPEAGWRVYANNVQAYGGLAWAARDAEGRPARLGTVLADPLSSVTAALVIAAWALGPERDRGAVADLSMAEVVASTVTEQVTAASLRPGDRAPDRPAAAHAVLPSADDRWVAVDLGGADHAGRARTADDLAAFVAARPAAGAAAGLLADGIPAAVVLRGPDLVTDPHLLARDFFPLVRHPDPDLGRARLVGLPWRFAGEDPVVLAPPPALGSGRPIREGEPHHA